MNTIRIYTYVLIVHVYADTACTRNETNNSRSGGVGGGGSSSSSSGSGSGTHKKNIIKQPEFIAPKMLLLLLFCFHILSRWRDGNFYTHAHAHTRKHTADFTKCVDLFDLPFRFSVRHLSPLESIFLFFRHTFGAFS